jgi:hypothetical protein
MGEEVAGTEVGLAKEKGGVKSKLVKWETRIKLKNERENKETNDNNNSAWFH